MPGGYNQVGDIATHTADGRELNVVWDELQAIMADANSRRTVIEGLLAHITVPVEDIVASVSAEELELASEFGEPVGLRAAPKSISMGSRVLLDRQGAALFLAVSISRHQISPASAHPGVPSRLRALPGVHP